MTARVRWWLAGIGFALVLCDPLPARAVEGTVFVCAVDGFADAGCVSHPAVQVAWPELSGNAQVAWWADAACSVGPTYAPVYAAGAYTYTSTGGCVAASTLSFGVGGLTPPFDVTQLDSAQVLEAFAAGFTLVGMCWALGQAVGAIMRVVRR